MKDVFQKLSSYDAGKVLDAACGRGEFINVLQQHVRSYDQIIGIDASEAAVKAAQNFFPGNNIEIYRMNLEGLDFADGYFDTVSISNSLHHLEHPQQVMNELMRVLKPGGMLIVQEMYRDGEQNQAQQTHILMHHWFAKVDTLHKVYHRETYTRDEIKALTATLPLRDVETEDFYYHVDNPKDKAETETVISNVQNWIKRCEAAADGADICRTGYDVIERIKQVGYMSASKLLITGYKQ